ncbi:MAG: hypothetical protein OXD46_11895 [Chloroflexi bacterium]|nr:hypothetical protein [Chloroflexota bacterium]
MQSLTIRGLVRRRVANSRWLLASVLLGVVAAATLVSAVPVYVSSLTQLSINLEIDNLGRSGTTAFIFTNNLILTESRFGEIERIVDDAVDGHILPAYGGRERILSTHSLWIEAGGISEPTSLAPPAAIIRNLTNDDSYIKLVSGDHASPTIQNGPNGPIIEAFVSENAFELYGVTVGDEVMIGVSQEAPARVTVRIAGVADNTSLDGTLVSIASGMLNPPTVYDPEFGPPPLPLFVSEEAVSDAISKTLPGMVMDAIWFIQLEPEALKAWTGGETKQRIDDFERELNSELFGTDVSTPLHRVINGAEARAFFARIPMILLLAVLAVTVAFYLGMMISYLVQSREEDHALIRTRGFGLSAIVRVYSFEGILLTATAIVVAPLLAIAFVAVAGVTPHFRDLTGGLLPIVPQPVPFIVAVIVGLLCLAAVVLPSVLTARSGVLAQRFQAARPPAISVLHRYHLDVVLLVLGGLIFWELQARGAVVSGGLFGDVDINEALLLAPVLFLLAVALLFMRLFPLFMSYVGGESPAILNLITTVSLTFLIPATVVNGVRGIGIDNWPQAAVTLAAFGIVYWATTKAVRTPSVALGILLQASLLLVIYRTSSPEPSSLLFWPFVALVSVVIGQPLFTILKGISRLTPVWVSITLRHVIRRPTQYTWLVVLVVLVTGVSVLATTVGGTLEQSRLDRVHHRVAGDLRINMSRQFIGGVSTFREMPSVSLAAEAVRTDGTFGPLNFEVLGVDSALFHRISWYRDDFSERPLDQVVAHLRPQAGSSVSVLPEGATSVGLWALPAEHYNGLMMNILLRDASGQLTTVFLGDVGPPEWKRLTAEIPDWLSQPVTLVAVHLQDHGDIRQRGISAGTILVDEIHATVGNDDSTVDIEDFESSVFTWLPIIADPLDPDRLEHFTGGAYRGDSSAKFTFGQQTDHGVRGLYKAPTRQFLPVVFSERLLEQSGLRLGVPTIIELGGREIVVIVMDTVKNFPTMSERTDRFVITDVDLLLGHINVLSSVYAQTANEVYIRAASDDDDQVEELGGELGRNLFIQASDRVSLLAETNVSPAMSAGWRALAIFALLVAVGAAAAGYVSYLILSDRGRRVEAAFLRSFGFSSKQLIALIAFEQLAIIAIALGLGTWAGFRMSLLLVSPLAESETGGSIVPPLLTVTDWSLLGPVYAALVAVFLGILIVVSLRALRVDLGAIARREP